MSGAQAREHQRLATEAAALRDLRIVRCPGLSAAAPVFLPARDAAASQARAAQLLAS